MLPLVGGLYRVYHPRLAPARFDQPTCLRAGQADGPQEVKGEILNITHYSMGVAINRSCSNA